MALVVPRGIRDFPHMPSHKFLFLHISKQQKQEPHKRSMEKSNPSKKPSSCMSVNISGISVNPTTGNLYPENGNPSVVLATNPATGVNVGTVNGYSSLDPAIEDNLDTAVYSTTGTPSDPSLQLASGKNLDPAAYSTSVGASMDAMNVATGLNVGPVNSNPSSVPPPNPASGGNLDTAASSRIFGPSWSSEELGKFYNLLKGHGNDFEVISVQLNRPKVAVKALYDTFECLLSRDEPDDFVNAVHALYAEVPNNLPLEELQRPPFQSLGPLWSSEELKHFHKLLGEHGTDFASISAQLKRTEVAVRALFELHEDLLRENAQSSSSSRAASGDAVFQKFVDAVHGLYAEVSNDDTNPTQVRTVRQSRVDAQGLGPLWSSEELNRFHYLLREHGTDFASISAQIKRPEASVRALHKLFESTLRENAEESSDTVSRNLIFQKFVDAVHRLYAEVVNDEGNPTQVCQGRLDALQGVNKKCLRNLYGKALMNAPSFKVPLGRNQLRVSAGTYAAIRLALKDFLTPHLCVAVQLMEHRGAKTVSKEDVDAAIEIIKSRKHEDKADR